MLAIYTKQPTSHQCAALKKPLLMQEQDLPGSQRDMEPEPFDAKLGARADPKPYTAVGKLRGQKTLITGGEYVDDICISRMTLSVGMQLGDWTRRCHSVRARRRRRHDCPNPSGTI